MRSLPPDLAARATLLDRAPSDVGGNRPRLTDGDEMLLLDELFQGRFTEATPGRPDLPDDRGRRGRDRLRHRRPSAAGAHRAPEGLPAAELDDGQRELLQALLATYRGRVPDGLAPPVDLPAVHFAGRVDRARAAALLPAAGPAVPGGVGQHPAGANHAHSVWRDPERDFGLDVLARHRAAHHPG